MGHKQNPRSSRNICEKFEVSRNVHWKTEFIPFASQSDVILGMRGEVQALSQWSSILSDPSFFRRSSVPVEQDEQRSISCDEFRVVI